MQEDIIRETVALQAFQEFQLFVRVPTNNEHVTTIIWHLQWNRYAHWDRPH